MLVFGGGEGKARGEHRHAIRARRDPEGKLWYCGLPVVSEALVVTAVITACLSVSSPFSIAVIVITGSATRLRPISPASVSLHPPADCFR